LNIELASSKTALAEEREEEEEANSASVTDVADDEAINIAEDDSTAITAASCSAFVLNWLSRVACLCVPRAGDRER
jgi:hypothetical protein